MLIDSGDFDPSLVSVYQSVMDMVIIPPVDATIYLKTSPEVAYQRMKDRARGGEEKITLEYLETCHAAHENWIHKRASETKAGLTVEGNHFIGEKELQCLLCAGAGLSWSG